MKSSLPYVAFAATVISSLLSGAAAQSASTATAAAPAGPIQTLQCYSGAGPLTQNNNDRFQTSGLCQSSCTALNKAVMAITGGSTCYCGDELPALDLQVSESKCNSPCQGFGSQMCGGIGYWQVYLTGITGDVQTAPNATSSSSTSSSSQVAQTVVVTQKPTQTTSAAAASSGGPSKVGIAVGVVVAVVVLATAIGALVFFLRQRRKREIEEEHKQQAAISSFVNANKSVESKSLTDQRLDPNVFTGRRESVGSIADERDFSRRILQVRNPDNRGSLQSVA